MVGGKAKRRAKFAIGKIELSVPSRRPLHTHTHIHGALCCALFLSPVLIHRFSLPVLSVSAVILSSRSCCRATPSCLLLSADAAPLSAAQPCNFDPVYLPSLLTGTHGSCSTRTTRIRYHTCALCGLARPRRTSCNMCTIKCTEKCLPTRYVCVPTTCVPFLRHLALFLARVIMN